MENQEQKNEARIGGSGLNAGLGAAVIGCVGHDGDCCKDRDAEKAEITRLNLELQKRDKCSFMGPMRDCPTHGDSAEVTRLREALDTIARVSDDPAIVVCAEYALTPNVELRGAALLRRPA